MTNTILSSTPLSQSGSNRKYFRESTTDGQQFIRVVGTCREENHAFITMARHFEQKGLPVPHVFSVSANEMEYTQTDLGDTLLFNYIRHGRESGCFNTTEITILSRTVRTLAHIQIEGAEGLDWRICYPTTNFDRRSIIWDLNYWKYCFLKGIKTEFRDDSLENDFEKMVEVLLSCHTEGFMYRDFQSRNVMVVEEDGEKYPYFIDFQGGRKGPMQYDIVSFLWQAKANFPAELRTRLMEEYLDEASTIYRQKGKHFDTADFLRLLPHFVLFRTLQVLGAYGYRGYFERKPHFLESIPFALNNLHQLFEEHTDLCSIYPYIYHIEQQLQALFHATQANTEIASHLIVTIYSFSYKKGIPDDASGNGGGYVFDCRSTHNPGKYDQYKSLTGLDQPVITFLEQDGEILTFMDSVYRLAEHHTERYIERNFSHLQICFGCTGGQHRSVYCAEALAKHLHTKYGVHIHLIHREQHIERTL